MTEQQEPIEALERRNFFTRVIAAVHIAIGGTLAFVLGGAVLAPSFERRESTWLRAGRFGILRNNEPLTVTLRVARQDGYAQVVDGPPPAALASFPTRLDGDEVMVQV